MKKITYLLFSAALLGSVSAHASGNVLMAESLDGPAPKFITPYGSVNADRLPVLMKTAPQAIAIDEDNAPSGEEKLFSTDCMCLMYDYIVDNTGLATRMRFAEDGAVYIHDLFSIRQDYWINAYLSDNNIVIPMHQQVGTTSNGTPLTLEVSTFKFGEDSMWSEIDRDAKDYTLCGQADGSYVSLDIDKPWEERQYLVLCDENDGTYNLIGSIKATPVEDSLITPPAGKDSETFSYSYFAGGLQKAELIDVVKDGNDIYVKGLCPALSEIWLKGEYNNDGTQVTFKSGQFMGADQYVHFFTAAYPNPAASANNPEEPAWLKASGLQCDVASDGTIEFHTDRYLAVTIAGDVAYTAKPRNITLYKESGGVPAKPLITEMVWMEVDFLAFVQPTYDVNGMYLNPDNLSWRMYYDNELFTFEPWEYQNLFESTTEIPYGFDDNWDFMFYDDIGEQLVAIYNSGYRNIGIESVYSFDGKEYVSERAYYGSTSVENIEAPQGSIVSTVLHDLNGRPVSNPEAGIYIRTDVYSDGTVRNRKISIR
ncbi:MAG: hypothetical protein K2H22_05085 [Muribaculaceae bacterium]|nr:hypothetical protein [Muribaculaceae bacterium]